MNEPCGFYSFISQESPGTIVEFAQATFRGQGKAEDILLSNFYFCEEWFIYFLKVPARVIYKSELRLAFQIFRSSCERDSRNYDNAARDAREIKIEFGRESAEAAKAQQDFEEAITTHKEARRKTDREFCKNQLEIWTRLFLDPANRVQ